MQINLSPWGVAKLLYLLPSTGMIDVVYKTIILKLILSASRFTMTWFWLHREEDNHSKAKLGIYKTTLRAHDRVDNYILNLKIIRFSKPALFVCEVACVSIYTRFNTHNALLTGAILQLTNLFSRKYLPYGRTHIEWRNTSGELRLYHSSIGIDRKCICGVCHYDIYHNIS